MKLRSLFTKQISIRLAKDGSAFLLTETWPLFSIIRRIKLKEVDKEPDRPFFQAAPLEAETQPVPRHDLLRRFGELRRRD